MVAGAAGWIRSPWPSDPGLQIRRNTQIIGVSATYRSAHAQSRRMNAVSQPQRYLINVEQYHKMGAAGVFPDDARVELIEGELLTMAPMGTPHVWAVAALTRALIESPLGRRIFLLPQLPIVLSDITEPHAGEWQLRLGERGAARHSRVSAGVSGPAV